MFIDLNGIRLAYSDTGSGSPVALLVHGYPLNRSMWDPQLGRLRAAGLRVIAPDPEAVNEVLLTLRGGATDGRRAR